MRNVIVAEFVEAGTFLEAARRARGEARLVDAYTPFPVEGMDELLAEPSRVRVAMFMGGALVAACAYGTEWYSAVVNYPINSGGRPLHSWPAFMLVPFAIGILSAAVCGFAAMMVETGLPRLHHPLFEIAGFRARQPGPLCALVAGT